MSAGISTKAMNSRIRRRLKKIQNQLGVAGVKTSYRNYSLARFEADGSQKIGGFNISFRVIRASNGESAATPTVYISHVNVNVDGFYGGWDANNNGSFDQGLAAIINNFSEVQS